MEKMDCICKKADFNQIAKNIILVQCWQEL